MSRKYLTPGVLVGHVVVLLAVLTCLRLGWWQWEVSQRPGGTAQNLGYAVLWPVFAGSFIYMWLRFLQLESTRDDSDDLRDAADALRDAADRGSAEPRGERASAAGPTSEVPAAAPPESSAAPPAAVRGRRTPARPVETVGVGYIGSDDEDDELAAYNRALAALAEQDDKRAR